MTIDLKTVKHISKLSRISIDDDKAKKLKNDLERKFLWKSVWKESIFKKKTKR